MSTENIPFREIPYLEQKLDVERREDGSILLKNGQPLKEYPPHLLWPFVHWAEHRPDTVWLAQRDPVEPSKDGWQTLTYKDALEKIRALAQGFIDAGAGQDAPVMILSRNSIDHALVMYAAMWAGSPVVPVTPAYALLSQDFARLNYIDQLTQPKFVYVEDGGEYQRGLDGMEVGAAWCSTAAMRRRAIIPRRWMISPKRQAKLLMRPMPGSRRKQLQNI